MTDAAVLMVVITACIGAYVLSIAPIVPGSLCIVAGAIAISMIEGWDTFRWWFWVGQAVLVVGSVVVDNVAQAIGVQRIGGSRRAILGGTAGVIIGPLVLAPVLNLFAVLIGPPVGAVVGTLLGETSHRRRQERRAGQAPPALPGARPSGAMPAGAAEARASLAASPSMPRIGVGALVAWIVGTGVRLGLVTIQVAWLLLEL